ncbi:MAG: hypothetical protein L6R39_005647 [Caloplaca ligustica]|nr:MAG: hypothetical protein L6R39_005647 [Caloplaca ligustica]
MDPAPPAWLRSYKAHSSIIPNYASQVRPHSDGNAMTQAAQDTRQPNKEVEKPAKNEETNTTATANPFTFPSTISLTLHNAGSLDNTYTNSTSTGSPQKPTFDEHHDVKSATGRTGPTSFDAPIKRRRGTICRFLAGIRGLLKSKMQTS